MRDRRKYSAWRVARNTVLEIYITPFPGSPLSHFTADESRYRKFIVGHLSETRYIDDREGDPWTMVVNDEVRSISYSPAADDLHLQCPGWPRVNTNCEYIPDPYVSVGDIYFELDKFYLDNFYVVLSEKKRQATSLLMVESVRARRKPNSAPIVPNSIWSLFDMLRMTTSR